MHKQTKMRSLVNVGQSAWLDYLGRGMTRRGLGGRLLEFQGKAAITGATLAYARFVETSRSERWRALAAKGAKPQRLLWASTATKNPAYSDVLYVESLIGPNTIVTIPPDTLRLFEDHGTVADVLSRDNASDARRVINTLTRGGIDFEDVNRTLEEQGIKKFVTSFDKVLAVIAAKRNVRLAEAERLKRFAVGRWENEGGHLKIGDSRP